MGLIQPGGFANSYQEKARLILFNYIKERMEKTDKHVTFQYDEVYVVWFTKTLKNWKCMLSTTLPDGMYYEITYNGEARETYVDAYKKWDNFALSDDDFEHMTEAFKPSTLQGGDFIDRNMDREARQGGPGYDPLGSTSFGHDQAC